MRGACRKSGGGFAGPISAKPSNWRRAQGFRAAVERSRYRRLFFFFLLGMQEAILSLGQHAHAPLFGITLRSLHNKANAPPRT